MKRALIILVGLYVAYTVLMIVLHPRFIYPFLQDDAVLQGFERVNLTGADGLEVSLQEAERDGPIVLYFMGNGGAVSAFGPPLNAHLSADRHVIAMEYRGGGGRPGSPSEADLKSDALVVADWALAKGKPVVVHGYSLGSGLATHVAKHRDVAGVILEAPYDKLCTLMSRNSFVPACLLPGVQKWNTLADAADVAESVLILHGNADRLIPAERSEALERLFPVVERQVIDGAAHFDTFRRPVAQFATQRLFSRVVP
jgi:pimeloyl-ACP methyl ester carboxylesterase